MNHRHFLETIARHPADMGPRLVYADFLEERGDVRAEYIRLAIELANRNDSGVTLGDDNDHHGISQCGKYHYMHLWKHGGPDYYEADSSHEVEVGLRVDVRKVVSLSDYGKAPDTKLIHGLLVRKVNRGNANQYTLKKDELTVKCTGKKCPICNSRTRCAALLAEHRAAWTMAGLPEEWTWCIHSFNNQFLRPPEFSAPRHYPASPEQSDAGIVRSDFARGMPEILTLRFEEWQRHYRTLIDAMPVREVNLTSEPTDKWLANFIRKAKVNLPDNFTIAQMLAAEFPGHDPAHHIKYTLPQPTDRLPRGIDPAGAMTGNEAISVTVPTIFPTPTVHIGGIP